MAKDKAPLPAAAPASDKKKAIDTAMAQIEKMYGKGSIMRFGDQTNLNVDFIPTGSLALDVALGIGGLALSLGTMIGGALVAEIIFSYPGLGSTMYSAVTAADYPLISATTLIITIMVLLSTFILDIVYGFIDPRVKAAQYD